jgi:nucleoside phosphorylase
MPDEQLNAVHEEARLLSHMTGPGRGIVLEHILSRLAAADPPAADLIGQLITALQHHDPASLPDLGRALSEQARAAPTASEHRNTIDLMIVTPKSIEEEAVLAAFEIEKTRKVQTSISRHTGYVGEADGFSVLICSPHADGNVRMSLFVREWLDDWKPRLGALVGMAGGRDPDVRPGDVVLATAIFDYQIVRRIATPSGAVDKNRFVSHVVREDLTTNFSSLDEEAWQASVKESLIGPMARAPIDKRLSSRAVRKWDPKMKPGIILAGSTLVEDGSISKIADGIHDQAIAVEMEGAGFAAAMTSQHVPWLSLRGIADMGGHPDYITEDGKSRTKEWQFAATFAAAHRFRAVMPDINVLQ